MKSLSVKNQELAPLTRSEVICWRASRTPLLLAAAALVLLPIRSFGLAQFNDFYGLPDGLANDVVRIEINGTTPNGTGTIISVVPDGNGGDYYNVLTADHVVYGATAINIGFRFDTAYPTGFGVSSMAQNVEYDGGSGLVYGADLAVFAVDVSAATLANLPANGLSPSSLLLPVGMMAPNNAPGNQIIQAGFGFQTTLGFVGGQWRYNYSAGFGTYNAGANTIPANGPGAIAGQGQQGLVPNYVGDVNGRGGNYVFDAIRGTFAVQTDAGGNPTSGTTYIMSGDSGGPTFESDGSGGLSLIGVHSDSYAAGEDTTESAGQGSLWSDVQVSSEEGWIQWATNAVDVPEPGSLSLIGMGLAAIAWRVFPKNKKS
jgi:hypothetical protein